MVSRVHIQMWALQLLIFLIMFDDIRNQFLLIETALINSIFGKIRLDDIQLAEMPSTFTLIAHTLFVVVVLEVMVQQLRGSFTEAVLLGDAELVIMAASMGLSKLADV